MTHASPNIVDVTFENAQATLIDESMLRPVLVDFWADWCAPCKQLMPVLENLAQAYNGAFLLAKVNADDMQAITQQFGVRSLPTVMLIHNGQPIDGFAGVQPESVIREMLDKVVPKPEDEQFSQAQQQMSEAHFAEALSLLREAQASAPQRSDITIHLAHCLAELGKVDEADSQLQRIAMVDQDAHFQQVKALIELKREAADTPEIRALQEQLLATPDDLHLQYQLALQLSQVGREAEALATLYEILKQDREFANNGARRTFIDILKALGNKDPLAIEFQRKLYSLLY
ncbi:MAG TPA: thioredoxin [Pseudomonadales bacterium]|nr:thioredoxin [Pseudomonadales bacterium]